MKAVIPIVSMIFGFAIYTFGLVIYGILAVIISILLCKKEKRYVIIGKLMAILSPFLVLGIGTLLCIAGKGGGDNLALKPIRCMAGLSVFSTTFLLIILGTVLSLKFFKPFINKIYGEYVFLFL